MNGEELSGGEVGGGRCVGVEVGEEETGGWMKFQVQVLTDFVLNFWTDSVKKFDGFRPKGLARAFYLERTCPKWSDEIRPRFFDGIRPQSVKLSTRTDFVKKSRTDSVRVLETVSV